LGPQNGAQNASDPRLRHPTDVGAVAAPNSQADQSRDQQKTQKKKGLFRRLMDVFK
jgi:hypothetical protein